MVFSKENIKNLRRLKDFGSKREGFYRLDKNERVTPLEENLYKKIIESLSPEALTIYPDQSALYAKLSEFLGIDKEKILLTSGADAAIKLILETYSNKGDEIVFCNPTYAMVNVYTDIYSLNKNIVDYDSNLEINVDQILEKINKNTKFVYIANPNQPTGTALSLDQIKIITQKAYENNTLCIIDEAYIGFCDVESCIALLEEFSNLVIIRTFSKAFGLASIRLGFIISASSNINQLYKLKTLYDINIMAVKSGEVILDNYQLVKNYIKELEIARGYLLCAIKERGYEVIDSKTNFIHIKLPNNFDLDLINERFHNKNFLIRTNKGGLPAVIEGCIRITLAPVDIMQKFIQAFDEIIKELEK